MGFVFSAGGVSGICGLTKMGLSEWNSVHTKWPVLCHIGLVGVGWGKSSTIYHKMNIPFNPSSIIELAVREFLAA